MSRNVCRVCTGQIYLMCRKGTGICGELCEKREKNNRVDNLEVYKSAMEAPQSIILSSTEIIRPEVPSLLGWRVAAQLQNVGRLMQGDIRRNPDQTTDMWDGKSWIKFNRVISEAVNG